jgi:hypothetical protein
VSSSRYSCSARAGAPERVSIVSGPACGLPSRSPDPAAEAKRRRIRGEASGEASADPRDGVPEALLEEPQATTDLVDDLRAAGAHLVGLPEDHRPLRQRLLDTQALGRGHRCVVEQSESAAMRRWASRTERRVASVGCAVSTSSTTRPVPASVSLSAPTPSASRRANASCERLVRHAPFVLVLRRRRSVVLLGDADELKNSAKARSTDARRSRPSSRRPRSSSRRASPPRRTGERANTLLVLEQLRPLLLDEPTAEEIAEQAYVGAQRRVGRHAPSLEAGQ